MSNAPPLTLLDAKGRPYTPAVAPPLRKLLVGIFVAVAVLSANGVYLASVTFLEDTTGQGYQNPFYFWMFLLHLSLGLLLILPFVTFGALHMRAALRRPNRRAVHAGIALFSTSLLVLVSGLGLLKNLGQPWNSISYWIHVLSPVAAVALYVVHRKAGPAIDWRWGWAWSGAVAAFVGVMILLHSQDPRTWNQVGPKEGEKYFQPSLARTATGNFIPASTLMMDEYCLRCHPDTYGDWFHSAHHFSSFNNPPYRFSVRETRRVALARDGDMQAARWCAGCHDPVPFFSGRFDDPHYDDLNDPTAQAGITCTVCHAISNLNSTRGNADYTIEEPLHYPFATSAHPFLQWINNRLVKGKPSFHKKTFLKPFHKTAEFCSTCHKVHIPFELNKYKEFLRGQNHYDPYLLSGVSGHGARSFYYPPQAKANCTEGCHMPLLDSEDFGNKEGKIHNHLFPAANTGLAELRGHEPTRKALADFLQDGQMRIDIFGVREGGTITDRLIAPLRPQVPRLKPGQTYLVEVVLRTLKLGHLFTQGTADSNQVWVDIEATMGNRIVGKNGNIDDKGFVDPWSHFVNVLMLDKNGNRIDRRNPQDIFVPLYNHQIPPGAGQSIHYRLDVPEDATGPIEISAKLRYRKFDRPYMEYVFSKSQAPNLTPVTLCADRVILPVESRDESTALVEQDAGIAAWERWNDYGIGLLLKGSGGAEKGELRQAEAAFKQVADLGRADGWVNLARVYEKEGRVDEAVTALGKAVDHPEPAPAWVVSWLSGQVNRQNGYLDEAIEDFRRVLSTRIPERGFDFSLDYEVWNQLGMALFDRSKRAGAQKKRDNLEGAREAFLRTLALDSENHTAHHNLYQILVRLGDVEGSQRHLKLFERYRPDNNARDRAHKLHRERHPAANKAAQSIVIYTLRTTS